MKVYIKSSECISAQQSFENSLPQELLLNSEESFYACLQPDYKKHINPRLLRRMSPIIRNGITCCFSALKKAGVEQPDAIIVGTALGCLKDTTSFLTQLIKENEQLPKPTHFIQSTHNTIAGQIALLLSCEKTNFTFSQNHNSFETALLDAYLLMLDQQAKNVLIGGVDEISEDTYELIKNLPCYKNTKPGDGAAFFVLSDEASKVQLKGLSIINNNNINFQSELARLDLTIEDIDVIIGGDNYKQDTAYHAIKECFPQKTYLWYKPFVGEFGTTSAIALWIGTQIIEEQNIPACWSKNNIKVKTINNILIYNKVGDEQSIMLLTHHQ